MRTRKIILIVLAAGSAAFAIFFADEVEWLWRAARAPSQTLDAFRGDIPTCPGCNLILLSMDTLREDTSREMRNLNLAAQQGIKFTRAYSNAYFTTPSHMSVFTSLLPSTHQVEGTLIGVLEGDEESGFDRKFTATPPKRLDAKYLTLAEVLRARGYDTYWNAPLKLKFFRFEDGFSRGFNHFSPSPFSRGLALNNVPFQRDFNRLALAPLQRKQPTFLFLHSYVTHGPYVGDESREFVDTRIPFGKDLVERFAMRIEKSSSWILGQSGEALPSPEVQAQVSKSCSNFKDMKTCLEKYTSWDGYWHAVGQFQGNRSIRVRNNMPEDFKNELPLLRKAYAMAAQNLDRQIGQMWDELRQLKALDNTVVVMFADHGESMLEHGMPSHGYFYEEITRVPVIIYHPRMKNAVVVDQPFSLVDLMPTILSILQIDIPAQAQGKIPWRAPREYVFGSTIGSDYITDGRWKLFRDTENRENFFDLNSDPEEKNNLVQFYNPWVRRELKRLRNARDMVWVEQSL